jgi:hypothetical protein
MHVPHVSSLSSGLLISIDTRLFTPALGTSCVQSATKTLLEMTISQHISGRMKLDLLYALCANSSVTLGLISNSTQLQNIRCVEEGKSQMKQLSIMGAQSIR